jgi:nucleoside-diphosphate-sugar epimerase
MKILVTGSSGTIGTRLCERLLNANHELVYVDWEPNTWNTEMNEETLKLDLRDETVIDQIPGDVDIVVHLAANARVYELVEHPERARDNVLTLFNTLEYARRNNVPRFIFASSREAYGNKVCEKLSEDMVEIGNCESPYTASKVGGEAFVRSYEQCYNMDAIIFRFSNVYGMYDNSVRVVPQFFRQAKAGETLIVFGEEKCLDFTYIDDCVNGIILGIEQFDTASGETYNLAYGEGTTLVHLAERIKELTGSTSEINMQKPRTGEVVKYIADISKAKNALGYSPQIPFDRGIELAVDWYEVHGADMSNDR